MVYTNNKGLKDSLEFIKAITKYLVLKNEDVLNYDPNEETQIKR